MGITSTVFSQQDGQLECSSPLIAISKAVDSLVRLGKQQATLLLFQHKEKSEFNFTGKNCERGEVWWSWDLKDPPNCVGIMGQKKENLKDMYSKENSPAAAASLLCRSQPVPRQWPLITWFCFFLERSMVTVSYCASLFSFRRCLWCSKDEETTLSHSQRVCHSGSRGGSRPAVLLRSFPSLSIYG